MGCLRRRQARNHRQIKMAANKPCPFCGGIKLRAFIDVEDDVRLLQTQCMNCSATGPTLATGIEWNTRTPMTLLVHCGGSSVNHFLFADSDNAVYAAKSLARTYSTNDASMPSPGLPWIHNPLYFHTDKSEHVIWVVKAGVVDPMEVAYESER